jgi:hypothetical protein
MYFAPLGAAPRGVCTLQTPRGGRPAGMGLCFPALPQPDPFVQGLAHPADVVSRPYAALHHGARGRA